MSSDDDVLSSLDSMLRTHLPDLAIGRASNGPKALELASRHGFQAAIVDCRSLAEGRGFAKALANASPATRFVLLVPYRDAREETGAVAPSNLGRILVKPPSAEEILDALEGLMRPW